MDKEKKMVALSDDELDIVSGGKGWIQVISEIIANGGIVIKSGDPMYCCSNTSWMEWVDCGEQTEWYRKLHCNKCNRDIYLILS